MFNECSSLKKLDLSSFKVENLSQMVLMFNGCSSLKELNLSSFNTKFIIHVFGLFDGCTSLEEINCQNNIINAQFMHSKNLSNS